MSKEKLNRVLIPVVALAAIGFIWRVSTDDTRSGKIHTAYTTELTTEAGPVHVVTTVDAVSDHDELLKLFEEAREIHFQSLTALQQKVSTR